LQNGLGDNIGNLLGNAVRQFTNSIKYTVADLPGVGVFMAGAELADAAVDAAKQGEQIVEQVENAVKPLNAVQAQVSAVTDAVDKATSNLPLGPGQEGDIEMTGLGPNAVDEESESGASPSAAPTLSTTVKGADGNIEMTELRPGEAASPSVASPSVASPSAASPSAATQNTASPSGATQSGASPSAATGLETGSALGKRTEPARQVIQDDKVNAAREMEENKELGGGGSRKRRRIHKLSRRIERTLRRVQKKYGLQSNQGDQSNQGKQDKNGFLRRTLRQRKH